MAPLSAAGRAALEAFFKGKRGQRQLITTSVAALTEYFAALLPKVKASYWARKVRTSVSISHRGTRAQHHSDPHRAMYSLTGCTRLLELITQDILRVSSCRTRKGARNWP